MRDFGAELAVDFPHLVVSNYQIHVRMETGAELSPRHPFVHGGWPGIDDDATG